MRGHLPESMRKHRTPLTRFARELRNESTDAERLIWKHLRNRAVFNCKFRRQLPIGPYIADFACVEKRLVIELDGGQHLLAEVADSVRTVYLKAHGYQVLRFWNDDVLQRTNHVLEEVLRVIENRG